MKYAALAFALLVAPAAAQDAPRFTMEPRPDLDWVTVPVVTPTAAKTNIALDVIPSAGATERGVFGVAWVHVCDNALHNGPLNCAMVAAGDKAVRFGSSNFDGEPARPIEFVVGNKVVGRVDADAIKIGEFDSAEVLAAIDVLIAQNKRQQEQIKALHQRIRALEKRR
jgi:hypothetical protein